MSALIFILAHLEPLPLMCPVNRAGHAVAAEVWWTSYHQFLSAVKLYNSDKIEKKKATDNTFQEVRSHTR